VHREIAADIAFSFHIHSISEIREISSLYRLAVSAFLPQYCLSISSFGSYSRNSLAVDVGFLSAIYRVDWRKYKRTQRYSIETAMS